MLNYEEALAEMKNTEIEDVYYNIHINDMGIIIKSLHDSEEEFSFDYDTSLPLVERAIEIHKKMRKSKRFGRRYDESDNLAM